MPPHADPPSAKRLHRALADVGLEAAPRPAFMANRAAAIRWLRRQQAAYVPTDTEELGFLRKSIDYYLAQVAPFFSKGTATLYRAILLKDGGPWRDQLQTERMGLSWTFDRAAARVYFTESSGDHNFDDALDGTVIEAIVGAAVVNWETSLIHHSLYEEEHEVRLLPDRPVLITAVGADRLPLPVLGSTGHVTQRWHDRR